MTPEQSKESCIVTQQKMPRLSNPRPLTVGPAVIFAALLLLTSHSTAVSALPGFKNRVPNGALFDWLGHVGNPNAGSTQEVNYSK